MIIQTLDFTLSEDLELFIAEHLKKLLRFYIPIVRAEVILGEDSNDGYRSRFCNIRLNTTAAAYLVAHHAASWEQAIQAAVDELGKKLSREVDSSLS